MNDVRTVPGNGDLPKILVKSADGSHAEVYLNGAHVASWIPAGGSEQLFVSGRSDFGAGLAIRGGVPIVFPQFGGEGPLPKHGFARINSWEIVSLEQGKAHLQLRDTDATRSIWPHSFRLDFHLSVQKKQMALELQVGNRGTAPLEFKAALHTYLGVADIGAVKVFGLQGVRFKERAGGKSTEATQAEKELRFTEELDRIYFDPPADLEMREPGHSVRIHSQGFPNAVVWNPGAAFAAKIPDMNASDYERFVCIEAAAVAEPIALTPGSVWKGSQILLAE